MSEVVSAYPRLFSSTEAEERVDVAGEDYVRFTGASDTQVRARGGSFDPRKFLEEGEVYEVEKTVVHRSFSDLYLKALPYKSFNSVCFEPAEPPSKDPLDRLEQGLKEDIRYYRQAEMVAADSDSEFLSATAQQAAHHTRKQERQLEALQRLRAEHRRMLTALRDIERVPALVKYPEDGAAEAANIAKEALDEVVDDE